MLGTLWEFALYSSEVINIDLLQIASAITNGSATGNPEVMFLNLISSLCLLRISDT